MRRLLALFASYAAVLLYHTRSFLYTTQFAGRDLIGAFSLTKVFEFGWSADWFLGFPLFKFYPPGFFFTTDLFGALVGDAAAFRLLIYLSLLVFPLAVYYCFNQVFDSDVATISFILSFAVVFLREPFSLVYQTLQVGLVAQMAALPLLFLYMGLIWKESRGSAYLLGVLMALMILTHPYIAAIATIYTVFYLVFERELFRPFFASTGFTLTGWWWIPILENGWYMQLYTGPTGKLANWPWVFLPLALLDRSKEAISFLLTALMLLLIGTFDFGLNLQFYRFFIYGQVLAVLAVAPGLAHAVKMFDNNIGTRAALALIFLAFLASSMNVDVSPEWRSGVELQGVVPEDGRMIVETSHSDVYNSYVPIQQIPLESNTTVVNGLYADQSVSSPYLLGLEKSFARNPVPNPIAVEADLTSQQLEQRFHYFGIEYALVRTEHARERLSFMEKTAENSDFTLLQMNISDSETVEAVPVKGSYSDWKDLNRQVFQGQLEHFVYNPESDSSVPIENLPGFGNSSQSIEVRLERESISPENRIQALFGLRYS